MMAFKSPFITKKAVVNKAIDLAQFRYDLEEIGIIGRGSFGVVVKARYIVQGVVLDTVVVRKLLQESVDDQNEFVKEARMLYNFQHENVVSFKAFCQRPSAVWNMFNLFYL